MNQTPKALKDKLMYFLLEYQADLFELECDECCEDCDVENLIKITN